MGPRVTAALMRRNSIIEQECESGYAGAVELGPLPPSDVMTPQAASCRRGETADRTAYAVLVAPLLRGLRAAWDLALLRAGCVADSPKMARFGA